MRLPAFLLVVASSVFAWGADGPPLEGTEALTVEGDLSAQMVAGIDKWLMRETERVAKARPERWRYDNTSVEAWEKVMAPKRELLRKMLGMEKERDYQAVEPWQVPFYLMTPAKRVAPLLTPEQREGHPWGGNEAPKAAGDEYRLEYVSWPVAPGVRGEGLLFRPVGQRSAAVMLLSDADEAPEKPYYGTRTAPNNFPKEAQFARRLAERGILVLVMRLVDRSDEFSGSERLNRWTNQPHREWIYRQAFEVGRTLIGYEVEKVFAGIAALRSSDLLDKDAKIGLLGYGEGGRIALHAAALNAKVDAILLSGAIPPADTIWRQPIDRNVMGFAREFGDAELASMISPRVNFGLEFAESPIFRGPPAPRNGRSGAAPGVIESGTVADYTHVLKGATEPFQGSSLLTGARQGSRNMQPVDGKFDETIAPAKPGSAEMFEWFVKSLGGAAEKKWDLIFSPRMINDGQRAAVQELGDHTQRILRECEDARDKLPLWTKIRDRAAWPEVQKGAKAEFWEKTIGKISTDYLPAKPRSRQIYDKEKWRGYDVMLDVHPDIFAWGILLVPKDLKPGEKRPVVVCQHGLEGVPADTINDDPKSPGYGPYKAFAARLADQGFIVYAPHNPYRGGDKFRVLQRKANPLGLSLFSFIIAQHDVTTRWLASLPFVDPERIGFYGLSYGGKSAMRIPAALDRYCLSICSADFNEWVTKNATTEHPFGYTFTNEYEIFEWDLGHTFNYAEMALLIAPRPFMVERGHDDGVGTSAWVGHEFGRVRMGYDKLGIGDRAEIEWFDGPHTINGVGTFKFLHKWLKWPER